jgi:lipoprotein-anchoring transpeptidase ErfK/SrfK
LTEDPTATSGRLRRPLVVLGVALLTLTIPGIASANGSVPVKRSQEVVALLRPHEAYAAPTSRSRALEVVPARTPLTEVPTSLPVLAHRGSWLKVRLPGRPNSHVGWIGRSGVIRSSTAWHLVVDLSRRDLLVYDAGRIVRTFSAVVGKPSTPTPTGEFFVEESIALSAGDVGAPFALALSARSNVLQEFDGGPGQIAMHGLMNVGGVLGTAVSHGCVRLANDTMRWLVGRIGTGVPVTITR